MLISLHLQARCKPLSLHSQTEIEREYARSDQVFIGELVDLWLESRPKPTQTLISDCGDAPEQECLERITITGGAAGPSAWLGDFLLEQQYKGDPAEQLRVRVRSSLEPGQRYLVYALELDDEWVADFACETRTFLVDEFMDEQISTHFAYLDNLPAAGAGGFVETHLTDPHAAWPAKGVLHIKGNGNRFELPADPLEPRRGGELLPVGSYQLVSDPPPGYRYECHPEPCDALSIQDRAVSHWHITLRGEAYVEIILRDSEGNRVSLDAEFELLDAVTAEPIDFVRDSDFRVNGTSIKGWLPPARLVPALVTSDVVSGDRSAKVLRRHQWFNRGLDFDDAKVWEIKAAESVIEFHLPETLDPVSIDINFDGEYFTGLRHSVYLALLGWAQPGERPISAAHRLSCSWSGDKPCQHKLVSLPGQTWSLTSYRYRFDGSDRSTKLLQFYEDSEINLVLEPR